MSNQALLIEFFTDLQTYCSQQAQFKQKPLAEPDEQFMARLTELVSGDLTPEALYEKGQLFVEGIIANYPLVTPALNRDILWLLGGNCMHFLSDEEIQHYQVLEDLLYDAQQNNETLTFQEAKAKALKLH